MHPYASVTVRALRYDATFRVVQHDATDLITVYIGEAAVCMDVESWRGLVHLVRPCIGDDVQLEQLDAIPF